jgi:glutaredoxin 3
MTAPKVEIYTVPFCGYCVRAKHFLEQRGVDFVEYDASTDEAAFARVRAATTRTTFPQIFVDGHPIGGYDDLYRLDRDGTLGRLLAGESVRD